VEVLSDMTVEIPQRRVRGSRSLEFRKSLIPDMAARYTTPARIVDRDPWFFRGRWSSPDSSAQFPLAGAGRRKLTWFAAGNR
jgi:hypothetical protein